MITDAVLVTGAAGFIGSHTSEALLRRGTPVVGIDNFDPYYDVTIKHQNVQEIENTGQRAGVDFTMVDGNICNRDSIEELVATHKIQAIVHLAAKAGVRRSLEDPLGYARTNIEGTVTLLEAACRATMNRFVFVSSSSVYGDVAQVPFSEDQPVNMPISPYAASKVAAESFCYTYHALHQLPVVCLRLFTVYGPRQRPDLAINKFVRLMFAEEPIPRYGDGTSIRDYTYIGDIVRGILAALDSEIKWDIINLGSDNPITLSELIAAVEQVLDKHAAIDQLPPQPGDMRQTHADVAKACRLLNWQPEVSLHEGLREFVRWWRSTR